VAQENTIILTILIAESVLCPHTSSTIGPMYSVDEAITTSKLSFGALDIWIAKQTRRHTGPEGKHHECEQIAHSQCASSRLIQ
jgi:hypothetical protein